MTAPGWAEEAYRAAQAAEEAAYYQSAPPTPLAARQAAATELSRLCVSREEALATKGEMLLFAKQFYGLGTPEMRGIVTMIEHFTAVRAALKDQSKEAGDGD